VTEQEFETLLERRADLRRQHEEWCHEVNGCRLSESSREAQLRDQVYAELLEAEAQIEAECEAERARGEA
jgi:hypothetical protein